MDTRMESNTKIEKSKKKMKKVKKEYTNASGPNWILDLDGPDGNVFVLWGLLKQLWEIFDWEGDPVEESKIGRPPYKGYEGVLDYCLHHLTPLPAGIEFRMYGYEIERVSDYQSAIQNSINKSGKCLDNSTKIDYNYVL